MEEYSRTKKNAAIRERLESELNNNEVESAATEIKKRINNEQTYEGTHQRNNDNHLVEETGEFKNEYLDSFIQEVREYNLKKGIKENEDTKLDILQQLSQKQRAKRAAYMENDDEEIIKNVVPVVEETNTNTNVNNVQNLNNTQDNLYSTQEIAMQVQDLLNETVDNSNNEVVEEKVEEVAPVANESTTASNYRHDSALLKADDVDVDEYTKQLVEETQQLKVQLDEAKNNIDDINSEVDKSNRMLNIIITILIIILLGVIGVVIYWLISGGIL